MVTTDKNWEAPKQDWTIETGLSREEEILIHCARLDLSETRHEAVQDLLKKGLDWDLLLEKAAWHRLPCLIHRHLKAADLSVFVPPQVLQKLQRLKYASLARNILLQSELSCLLSAFNKGRIPVIVLKGAALLDTIYQDISLRPMSDLDILVKPEHLDITDAIAISHNYVARSPGSAQERSGMKWAHLPHHVNREKGVILEIHQRLVRSDSHFNFDLTSFWSRAQPFSVAGTVAKKFACEDQIVHLCIKFLLDRRYNSNAALGQLCDISEIICQKGDSLNWDLLEKVAKEHRIEPGIHCVLYCCKEILGSRVPEGVLGRLQPIGFDRHTTELFFHRRVLDMKPWLPLNLIASRIPYGYGRALRAIVGKLFHAGGEIFHEKRRRDYAVSFHIGHMRHMLPVLGRVLFKPSELRQDLLLDRWLHNTCSRDLR